MIKNTLQISVEFTIFILLLINKNIKYAHFVIVLKICVRFYILMCYIFEIDLSFIIIDVSSVKNVLFYEDGFLLNLGSDMNEEIMSDTQGSDVISSRAVPVSLKGGDWLQNSNGANWSTLGYGAFQNYGASNQKQGYVTCGHGYTQGQAVYVNGSKIGTARSVAISQGLDITFIESAITYAGQKNNRTASIYGNPIAGETVYMYGAKSGSRTGTISSTNIKGTWSGTHGSTYHTDLFSFNFPSQKGDSGSALVSKTSSGKLKLVGLNLGMWYEDNDSDEALVWGVGCKWENAANAINVVPRNP